MAENPGAPGPGGAQPVASPEEGAMQQGQQADIAPGATPATTGETTKEDQPAKAGGLIWTPTTDSNWVTPGYAAIVVAIVAVVLLLVLGVALLELRSGNATADPNAGTIAALAGAAISSLTSLTAAYFGIKVASEQSAQAAATAQRALDYVGNSTLNGNPSESEL